MTSAMNKSSYKRSSCCIWKLRCFIRCYKVCRIKCKQLWNMSVTNFNFVIIHCPFLYLTIFSYFRLRELFKHSFKLFGKIVVSVKYFTALYNIFKKNCYYLAVHWRACTQTAFYSAFSKVCIFRRYGRTCNKLSVLVFNQIICKELSRLTHERILFTKKILVLSVFIMFKNMKCKPRTSHRPYGSRHPEILRSSIPPEVCIMVADIARTSVHFLCSFSAVLPHLFKQVKKREVTFWKITAFCTPVVHLCIYINNKSASPQRLHIMIPYSLKVKRKSSGTASGNHEISCIVEVKHHKTVIMDMAVAFLVIKIISTHS